MTAHQTSTATLRRAALRAHRAAAFAGTAPGVEFYPASIAARLAAAAHSGETAVHRFAPPQRDRALLGLQRTVGNGAVERLLRAESSAPAPVQREETAPTNEPKKVETTPPPVKIEAVAGLEGEKAREHKTLETGESEVGTEKGLSAKFAVSAKIPLLQAGGGPLLVLNELSVEGGVAFDATDKMKFRGAAMGASLKAFSLEWEDIKPPLKIPGSISLGFGGGIVAEAAMQGRNTMGFKVGGQLGAEAKYQFKDSPLFITAEVKGTVYWGAGREPGMSATFDGASYTGMIGVGVRFGGGEKKK